MVRIVATWVLGGLLWAGAPASAEESFSDFSELDLENLLDQVVVTASRRAQKSNEAPVATYVVTAEDIRRFGAATIPDALRLVPGLEVMSPSLTNASVSARGLNEIAANTMMVLIDGRSVYAEFNGLVLWEMLPIDLNDVESIEVTRSPASALYGANALAGVINIITFDPGDDVGITVNSSASEFGSSRISGALSGRRGNDVAYRFSGGYQHTDHVGPLDYLGYSPRLNGDVRWELDRSTLSLSAGQAGGRSRSFPISLGSAIWIGGRHRYARADYSRGDYRFRAYWNHYNLDLDPEAATPVTPLTDLRTDSVDLEYQQTLEVDDRHLLSWSANYRHNLVDWTMLPRNYGQDLYGLAVNDEWRLSRRWIASAGVRFDHHPLTDGTLSPRASLLFTPRERHTLRVLFSQAHRNPTFLESYLRFEGETTLPGFPLQLNGNRDLVPEGITAFEASYQGMLAEPLLLTVEAFHNAVEVALVDTYSSPPAPVPGVPREYRFLNTKDLDATGGEIAVGWTPTPRVRLLADYAYTWIENAQTGRRVLTAPRYKASVALTVRPAARVSVHAATRFVSRTEFEYDEGMATRTGSAGDYLVTDLGMGYRAWGDRIELAAGVQNLFDDRYREYAAGIDFRRRIFATAGVRF